VNVEMLGQLDYRPIAFNGGQRHLRLEGRSVVPAKSSLHGLSCSRRLSPLSGRNSTYGLVQISGTGSDLRPLRGLAHDRLAERQGPAMEVLPSSDISEN
jgi:hypothetical protein